MSNVAPPFRADMVGSLLRTAPLKDARAKREKGEIGSDELRKIEDEEIAKHARLEDARMSSLASVLDATPVGCPDR